MPLMISILQRLKAKPHSKPRRRRVPIPPVEAMEVRILMSATALDSNDSLSASITVTPINDVAAQEVPDVIDDGATTGVENDNAPPIDGAADDSSGDSSNRDVGLVDDLGNDNLQGAAGNNEVLVGEQYDNELFTGDGIDVFPVICTMGLNPIGTSPETTDDGTVWNSNSSDSGDDIPSDGNQDNLLPDDLGNAYLQRTDGNDVPEGGDGSDILPAATWGEFHFLEGPVPMMFQAGAFQPGNFENVAAQDTTSNDNHTLNGGTDNGVLPNGVGNDFLKEISSQYYTVGGTGANLPASGTSGGLMVSGSNPGEKDLRGLWLLFSDSNPATPYETGVDQLKHTQGGTNIGGFPNSTAVSDESDVDHLTGGIWTDSYFATSPLDGLANAAVDEVFTHIDSLL